MCISTLRTLTFHLAMESGQKLQILDNPAVGVIGVFLACVGTFFVLASFWQLGFYGTFLGDHFGILMSAPVRAFPFSVMDHPMYWGSIIAYFGDAVHSSSASGLVLACWILVTYGLANGIRILLHNKNLLASYQSKINQAFFLICIILSYYLWYMLIY